jgi:hypothetical protein
MRNTATGRTGRGRGFALLVTVGVLGVGLGIGGVGAVLARGSASQKADPPTRTVTMSPAPAVSEGPSPSKAPTPEPTPAPDPHALADGVYPTFIRDVDVEGGTIVVDVLQLFVGEDARQAAIEDNGVEWWEENQYNPVYLRNENPLLRRLPVADDVDVKLPGLCDSRDRSIDLARLRKVIWPFNEGFYYEVTMRSGTVERIEQKVAIAGC